jgi:hypothetical protein
MMTETLQKHLHIDVKQFGSSSQHLDAIRRNGQRGLPEVPPAIISHDGTMILVGSGWSAPHFIEDIRKERERGRPICAIKGAHDLLCEHDIIPDLFVSVEPRDRRGNLKHKNSQTVYLLASRVSPEVFDHLSDCKVMIWHSWGHDSEIAAVREQSKFAIGGGSTSGLRAIAVCYLFFGFRNFRLYGYDSCNDPKDLTTKRFDGSQTGVTHPPIYVGEGEHRKGPFICNMAMAAQAEDFQKVTYGLFQDIHIEAKGDGLIAAILEDRKIRGKRV